MDTDVSSGYVSIIGAFVTVYEEFRIHISKKWLEKYTDTGITIQLRGRRGVAEFAIPGFYVEGFLARLPDLTAGL
jgi:hypothetical protein